MLQKTIQKYTALVFVGGLGLGHTTIKSHGILSVGKYISGAGLFTVLLELHEKQN